MKKSVFIFLFLTTVAWAQEGTSSNIFSGKTSIPDPLSLRDPFKSPILKVDKKDKVEQGTVLHGVFTNIPEINTVPLSKIKIIGVVIGKERRALAQIEGGKQAIMLKEGMLIGSDKAELKAILPAGVVVVEKVINVYGQVEYLETVLAISG
ncbi:MAG: hypothetical protein KBD63_02585 [Bacteriovoracaceae bacterium]|nr:hypothetical protein [Bacteriovoracaceae bacterium]